MIVAETNGQAEQCVSGAAGQVTRASADQEVTHNTPAQNVEDYFAKGWEAAKRATVDLVDRGPEAVTDAFGAASNEIEHAWKGLWEDDKDDQK